MDDVEGESDWGSGVGEASICASIMIWGDRLSVIDVDEGAESCRRGAAAEGWIPPRLTSVTRLHIASFWCV